MASVAIMDVHISVYKYIVWIIKHFPLSREPGQKNNGGVRRRDLEPINLGRASHLEEVRRGLPYPASNLECGSQLTNAYMHRGTPDTACSDQWVIKL